MPVTTRNQYKAKCGRMFKDNIIENPCILQIISSNLNARDLVSMKQISKDSRFVDLIDYELKKIHAEKEKIKHVTTTIRNYLCSVEDTYGTENRIALIVQMYDFICDNKLFVLNPKFSKTFHVAVHSKLFQLIKEYPPFQEASIKYLGILFGLKPPKDYYNSKLGLAQYGMFDVNNKFVALTKK